MLSNKRKEIQVQKLRVTGWSFTTLLVIDLLWYVRLQGILFWSPLFGTQFVYGWQSGLRIW